MTERLLMKRKILKTTQPNLVAYQCDDGWLFLNVTFLSTLTYRGWIPTSHVNLFLFPAAYQCDDGWLLNQAQCHQFNDSNLSWMDSRTACKSQGADLITIYNSDMQTFVESKHLN